APNGSLEDSFYQATGRPLWNAANIYAPTLVITGDFDTWSFQEDREGLMRALVHAPTKRHVVIKDASHFVLFEKNRVQFFEAILKLTKKKKNRRVRAPSDFALKKQYHPGEENMLRFNTPIGAIPLLLVVNLAMAHTPSQPPHQLFNEGDLKL